MSQANIIFGKTFNNIITNLGNIVEEHSGNVLGGEMEVAGGAPKLYRFPENVTTAYPTWVKYEIWDFVPMGKGGSTHNGKSHFGVNVAKSNSKSIALGLDQQVETTENQSWKQEAAGGIIDQLVKQAAGALVGGSTKGMQGLSLGELGSGAKDLAMKKLTNSGVSGSTITDKMALKYDGPDGVRSFTMNHKFVPRNAKESAISKEIIKQFRIYSAPAIDTSRETGDGATTFFTSYKFPSLFKVLRMSGANVNKNFPQYDLCYCKSVNVKYGDESANTFHGDNSPVSFEISLSFEEIAIPNRKTIGDGG